MHPRLRILRRACFPALLAIAACVPATPLRAQAVRGHVVEAETGAPVPSALVSLLDAEGRPRAATVSDAQGGYHLAAPGAGVYRLRTERIGH
ncbi:MAG TPA: carboxypeptidase-like regulatory domain-containing protein, partial [Longimicrobium sp.]|nr:carboxypeptidase-like regulatory domain-containing protein [Longimicrobium sp.]